MPASGKWRWSTREPTRTRGAAQPGPRQPVVAWPRRQVAAAAVAPAAVLPGVLLIRGRRGKALAACPLLGVAAGGFRRRSGGGKGVRPRRPWLPCAGTCAGAWSEREQRWEGERVSQRELGRAIMEEQERDSGRARGNGARPWWGASSARRPRPRTGAAR